MIKINPSILSKTVKAITPKTEKVEEAQIRGTIVYRNQEHFVQLDGAPSNALTPIAEFAEGASDAGFVHGDRVLVLIKNHQAIVTKNLTTGLQAQAAKEASAFTTAITDEGITAQRIIANDTFTNTLRANHITADEIIAGMATIDTLDTNYAHITNGVIDNAKIGVADVNDLSANYAHITTGVIDNAKIDVADVNNLSANYAHITNGVIDNAKIGYADVNDLDANYAHITSGVIDNAKIDVADVNNLSADYAHITNGVIDNAKIGYADVNDLNANYAHITSGVIDNATIDQADINNLAANYAKVNAANIDSAAIRNAWVDKIMVQTGLLAYSSQVYTLDAIEVNAANITAGTLDVNRLIVTVGEGSSAQKYLVNIDPSTGTPSYEKLDGNIVEPRTITADKIVANSITTNEITANNLVGTNGWINLHEGKFFYGDGANFASATNAISWNGSKLQIKADEFLLSSGKTIQEELEAIETWFYAVAPTTSNPPANSWTSEKLKEQHLRDIYFDTTSGKSYRWAKEGSTYKWVEIEDVELVALAKDLHDNYPPRSEFTVAPDKIQSTVSAAQTAATNAANTATDNKLKSYYTKIQTDSAITQKAGEISLSVAQTEIGKIEVGGRNLCRGSNKIGSESNHIYGWVDNTYGIPELITFEGEECIHLQAACRNNFIPSIRCAQRILLEWGNVEYVISCDLRFDVETKVYGISVPVHYHNGYTNTYNAFDMSNANNGAGFGNTTLRPNDGTIIPANTWTHFEQHIVTRETGAGLYPTYRPFIYGGARTVGGNATVNLYLKNYKVEKGNKATTWTPAPEDIDAEISETKASITLTNNSITSLVEGNTTYTKPDGTTGTSAIGTAIKQTQDNILIKATKNDTTNIAAGKTIIESLINVNPDTVKIKAKNVEIDGTATFNAIKSSTDAAYDAKNSASTVQTNLDNLKVGGRNLLWDTEWQDALHRWHEWGAPTTREIVNVNGARYLHLVTTNNNYQGYEQAEYYRNGIGEIKGGDKIVVSLTAYAATAGQKVTIGVHWRNSAGSIIAQSWLADNGFTLTTTPTRYVSPVWTVPDGAVAFNCMIGQGIAAVQELWISHPMMEKATKASDWSPAPEDVQSEIDAKKSAYIFTTAYEGFSYAQLLNWSAEGHDDYWTVVEGTAGVKIGDTVRIQVKVNDMGTASNRPSAYIVGTVKSVDSATRLRVISHGLDTTIIDGGNILTNSITSNQIAANAVKADELDTDSINNSGLLNTGALTVGARNDVLNSNIEVGGRNLLLGTSAAYTWTISITGSSTYAVHDFYKTYAPINSLFKANDLITISFDWSANATTGNMHLECGNASPWVWGTIVNAKGTRDAASNFIDISSSNRSGHVEITFKVTSSQTSAEDSFRWFRMRVDGADAWNGKALTILNAKCEFGNKATAWSPALEDDASGKNLMRYTHKLSTGSASGPTATYSTGSDSRVPSGQFFRATFSSAASGGVHILTSALGWDYNAQMVNGTTYTFSAWVRSNKGFKFSSYGPERFTNKSTKVWSILAGEWTHIWCTGVFDTSTQWQSCSFYTGETWAVGDYLDISSMKLEIGTKPTPWTPAPEDMAISYMHADSNGLRIASGYPSTQNQRIQMTAADIDMYDSANVKRLNLNANTGVTVGRPDKGHTVLNDNGLHMYDVNNKLRSYVTSAGLNVNDTDGSTNVAVFGASARVGKSATRHIEVKDGGMQVYQDSTYVMAHIGYGTTNNGSGTETAPYYTFGHRNSGYANGKYSVCEGYDCAASQATAHAEGTGTQATASAAHSEGSNTTASGYYSHAEGYQTTASGYGAHASGYGTTAQAFGQTAVGRYNVAQGTSNTMVATDNAFIVGNGSSLSSRSNALAVTYQGKMTIASTLTQNSDRRLKEHIAYIGDEAVEFIDGLKPAHYTKDGEKHVGFYAQDVEKIDKWDCMTGEMNGYMTLGYTELIAPLVAYVQKLEKRIEELERSK